MDFMNTPEQFAHIPKDILRDRRMTLAAKGLYSVICTFGPDSPVSITAVAELLGLPAFSATSAMVLPLHRTVPFASCSSKFFHSVSPEMMGLF